MECFDISHISGTFVVASMVHFTNGRPDKDQYRRFSIKSFVGNDDFKAMQEVVSRRYRRLIEEQKQFPDLVVIDGGRGQVAAALKAFVGLDCMPPAMIGLAKKMETIIFPDARTPLNLPISHPGLNLLQRLRDEAHRFANTYNADLQSRKIKESVLDDFPGLGEKRKAALLAHFGSLDKLRAASIEQIAAAPGFGKKFSWQLHAFLAEAKPASLDHGSFPRFFLIRQNHREEAVRERRRLFFQKVFWLGVSAGTLSGFIRGLSERGHWFDAVFSLAYVICAVIYTEFIGAPRSFMQDVDVCWQINPWAEMLARIKDEQRLNRTLIILFVPDRKPDLRNDPAKNSGVNSRCSDQRFRRTINPSSWSGSSHFRSRKILAWNGPL